MVMNKKIVLGILIAFLVSSFNVKKPLQSIG